MCGDWVGGTKWNGQKLKELLRSETLFAMCGKDPRSLSKERGNAAPQIKCLRMAHDHWVVATSSIPGRQDNDFEAPQATQSAVLFPFPD